MNQCAYHQMLSEEIMNKTTITYQQDGGATPSLTLERP